MDREIRSRAPGAYVMPLKPVMFFAASFAAALLAALPQASAGGSADYGNVGGGPHCKTGSTLIINKNISIYKPVTIDKNIDINKNININKTIDASKHISIYKNIVINKGGGSAEASAWAAAAAAASANASASANVTVYNGSYEDVRIVNKSGAEASASAEETCEMQDATVMKAIHAVCVAQGREFAASHMLPDTFIDSSYEGEVARCLPGAVLKVVIGDVVQSDQGMAGTYSHGQVLQCGPHEALRHYKDGMLKCVPEAPVKDCTERTNLRLYGTGDFFFTFRTQVCASASHSASAHAVELTGMALDGGVGADSGY
jgi:hypothetical protein